MSAILNFLNAHNFIFQPILMTLVSRFMVYRALSDETYLSIVLRSPLNVGCKGVYITRTCYHDVFSHTLMINSAPNDTNILK